MSNRPPTVDGEKQWPSDLTAMDFARLFGTTLDTLPEVCLEVIRARDFRYRVLSEWERDEIFLDVFKALSRQLEVAGAHRIKAWEEGWSETLADFRTSNFDLSTLVPRFVRPDAVIRLDGNYIRTAAADFETGFVTVLRRWLFDHWFKDADHVYEFGCGTGHNLVELAQQFPDKHLHGLDWATASQQIIYEINNIYGFGIECDQFDLMSPNSGYVLEPGSGVFTVGTLEQMGTNFGPFLEYVLKGRPNICVNVEVLSETLDQDNLFDYVAARYIEKRGYLNGYLKQLRNLESEGQIEILQVQRTFGSLFHNGYEFVVWRPL